MSAKATQIDFLLSGFDNAKGGTVTAYAAGTTDLKTVWLDREKQTAADNPYTLNASRGAAQLYGDGIYKFVIKDSTGQIITGGTLDNIAIGLSDGPWVDVAEYASLTAAVTAIGATETTLLVNSATTLTASTAIPATLVIKPTSLGMITIPSGMTLTINSAFDAPLYQFFDGTGTLTINGKLSAAPTLIHANLTLGAGATSFVYPEWYGIDGTADDVEIQKAANTLATTRKLVLSQSYNTTAAITFTSLTGPEVEFVGNARIVTAENSGMTFTDCINPVVRNITILNGTVNWDDAIHGLSVNGTSHGQFEITKIGGYTKGLTLEVSAAGSSLYNRFDVGLMVDNKYDTYFKFDDTYAVNENTFNQGAYMLTSATKAGKTGSYVAYAERTAGSQSLDNIRFISPAFESKHNGIYFGNTGCVGWLLLHPRIESVDANWLQGIVSRSVFLFANQEIDRSKINLDVSNSRNNTFIGKDSGQESTLNIESTYGGLGFYNYYDHTQFLGRLWFQETTNRMLHTDAAAQTQAINKQYEGTAAPTAGTYRVGAQSWNTNATAGQPIGWTCSASGTMGTLNSGSTTASGTSGDAFVTVNATTGLHIGANISIAGVTGTKVVTGIVGTTVYLDSTIDATVSGAAVAFVAATWKAMPNYS